METENMVQTRKHIMRVGQLLHKIVVDLLERADKHDASKLESPEAEIFEEYTKKLRDCEYGSEDYKRYLAEMKPALDHHYKHNSHHPEFHDGPHSTPFGHLGMDLVDLIEMLADWVAASERHQTGDIHKSIEINKKRFNIPDSIVEILRNTVPRLTRPNSAHIQLSGGHIEEDDVASKLRPYVSNRWLLENVLKISDPDGGGRRG